MELVRCSGAVVRDVYPSTCTATKILSLTQHFVLVLQPNLSKEQQE